MSEGETKHCQRQYLVISRPLPLVSLSRGAWERSGRRAAWWTRSPSLAIQQITRQHYTSRRVWGTVGGCMYLCRTAFGRANTRPVQRHCHPPRAAPGVQGQYVIFYTPDGNDTVVRARDRDPRDHDRIEHVCIYAAGLAWSGTCRHICWTAGGRITNVPRAREPPGRPVHRFA